MRAVSSVSVRLILLLALGLGPGAAGPSFAQQASRESGTVSNRRTPYTDTLRVLVLLTKFADDQKEGSPALYHQGWPLYADPSTLPPFAAHLVAPTPSPPFVDSTLTAYFYEQSQGRFVVFGDVYPEVLVTEHPEARYHKPDGGYGYLTVELLDRLDAAGFDFAPYDNNRDGELDQIFIVIRRDSKRDEKVIDWTGISCLDARCGGGIAGGKPRQTPTYDGKKLDWNGSGSIILNNTPNNLDAHSYHVRMMAHELGHDLWRESFYPHILAFTGNGVPAESNRDRTCLGYALMAGKGGGMDCRGDVTISAFERDLLGWIDCEVLDASQDGVVLGDLYSTSDCKKVILTEPSRVLYLTNRQRVGPFDQYRRAGRDAQYEVGLLRTTGLLVTLADGTKFDVVPADNSLDLSDWNKDYEGDLFGPSTRTQLTPWTRPNINGFTEYKTGAQPRWYAVDDIRYTGADGGEMAFDFIEDFRIRPAVREDSWIGAETAGYTFEHPFVVTNGSTLTISTHLTFADTVRVEPGARVLVEPPAVLQFTSESVVDLQDGAEVVVEGQVTLAGKLSKHPRARLLQQNGGAVVAPSNE